MRRVVLVGFIVSACSSPSSMPDAASGDDAAVPGIDAAIDAGPDATGASGSVRVEIGSAGQLVATDANSDALTYRILTPPTKGTISALDPATGAYTYTTTQLTATTDSFTFQVNDGTSDAGASTRPGRRRCPR